MGPNEPLVQVTTEEGEQIHYHQEELSVGTQLDGETDTALLLWPLIISHKYYADITDQTYAFLQDCN